MMMMMTTMMMTIYYIFTTANNKNILTGVKFDPLTIYKPNMPTHELHCILLLDYKLTYIMYI